jgi:hypothetical protein
METQILALKCPSCGNTSNLPGKEAHYGFQFACEHCQTTSVLVINKQLYTPRLGEHICISCGRIAIPDARFCQCGAALVRRCDNLNCLKEISVDHSICDFCGWPQFNSPKTDEGEEKILKDAISNLHDINIRVREEALQNIRRLAMKASAAIPVIYDFYKNSSDLHEQNKFIDTLGELGELAIPYLIKILSSTDSNIRKTALQNIIRIGPKASVVIPGLPDLYKKSISNEEKNAFLGALVNLGESAIPVLIEILCSESDDYMLSSVQFSLEQFGVKVLPALRRLLTGTIPEKTRAITINIIERILNK